MAAPKTKRAVTKTEQLVLRLSKKTVSELMDIVASASFKTTRVAVIESLIANEHVKLKQKAVKK